MSFLTPSIISGSWFWIELPLCTIICHFKILYINSVLKISDFRRSYPSDLRKKILISDFRVPTFEPVSISDSSDFQHLWLVRPTSAFQQRWKNFFENFGRPRSRISSISVPVAIYEINKSDTVQYIPLRRIHLWDAYVFSDGRI